MENENHFYIISYDLDGHLGSQKSKELLAFLNKFNAICLTKSTWLLCTPSDCWTVFQHTWRTIEQEDWLDQTVDKGYSGKDRLFVAEITGNVFGEYLICDERNSTLTLDELLETRGNSSVKNGFKAIYGE